MLERFTKNNCKKKTRVHMKWEEYDNSFNTWIDKKDII